LEQLLLARDSTQAASGVSTDVASGFSTNVASGFSRTSRSPDAGRDAPDRSLRQAVHRHITRVLGEVGGNKRRAARELRVSRATLDRKLRDMARAAGSQRGRR